MIINPEETIELKNRFDGKGSIFSTSYIKENDFQGIRKVLEIELEPHASIGYHEHVDEGEIYHIIEGKGEFQDSDGTFKAVTKGDCCVITSGQSHGLVNTEDTPLKIVAIIF